MSTKSGAPWGCSTYVLVYGQCQSCRPVSFQNLNEAVEVKTSKKEEEAWLFVLEFWKQSAARPKWNLGRWGSSGRGSGGKCKDGCLSAPHARSSPEPLIECLPYLAQRGLQSLRLNVPGSGVVGSGGRLRPRKVTERKDFESAKRSGSQGLLKCLGRNPSRSRKGTRQQPLRPPPPASPNPPRALV